MGIVAASLCARRDDTYRPERLPRSVNTHPELAAVGMTEEEAANTGIDAAVGYGELEHQPAGHHPRRGPGRPQARGGHEFGEILGAHMVGVAPSK